MLFSRRHWTFCSQVGRNIALLSPAHLSRFLICIFDLHIVRKLCWCFNWHPQGMAKLRSCGQQKRHPQLDEAANAPSRRPGFATSHGNAHSPRSGGGGTPAPYGIIILLDPVHVDASASTAAPDGDGFIYGHPAAAPGEYAMKGVLWGGGSGSHGYGAGGPCPPGHPELVLAAGSAELQARTFRAAWLWAWLLYMYAVLSCTSRL
jgi:hypothetical protein